MVSLRRDNAHFWTRSTLIGSRSDYSITLCGQPKPQRSGWLVQCSVNCTPYGVQYTIERWSVSASVRCNSRLTSVVRTQRASAAFARLSLFRVTIIQYRTVHESCCSRDSIFFLDVIYSSLLSACFNDALCELSRACESTQNFCSFAMYFVWLETLLRLPLGFRLELEYGYTQSSKTLSECKVLYLVCRFLFTMSSQSLWLAESPPVN